MSTAIEWVVMSAEPLRPTIIETVLYEPDDDTVIAVLPGSLWLAPGDIVEVDDPPRDARVPSTRLQLRGNEARVLIVLDIPADADDALRGDDSTEVALGAEVDHPLTASEELDNELEKLTEELHQEAAPDET